MNGKKLLVATLFAAVLLTMTFIPTSSQQTGTYDPWLDINDDGKIDIRDLATMAKAYGTLGTPINKTQLLLELQARVDALNASIIELQARKRYVAGQVYDLPNLALDQPMPYLSGATEENTIVVASIVGDSGAGSNATPLFARARVTSPTTIRFTVWDSNGNSYDPTLWNWVEINYIVIDR